MARQHCVEKDHETIVNHKLNMNQQCLATEKKMNIAGLTNRSAECKMHEIIVIAALWALSNCSVSFLKSVTPCLTQPQTEALPGLTRAEELSNIQKTCIMEELKNLGLFS